MPVPGAEIVPAQLREQILQASIPYRGYAESDGSLGLPDLPEAGDVAALFGGRTRLRVWHAAPDRSRVDLLTPTGERGFYTTRAGATTWNYERDITTDLFGEPDLRLPRAADLSPPELARRLLGGPRGTEQLSGLPARRIAGISAAGLRLAPADPDTTIGAVEVWADPATGLALEVRVSGRSGGPSSLTSRFLEVAQGPGAVPAEVLVPPYPDGSERASARVPRISELIDGYFPPPLPERLAGRPRSTVLSGGGESLRTYGQGFSTFAAVALPPGFGRDTVEVARSAGAQRVSLDGGEAAVLSTALLTLVAVLPDGRADGYVLAGTVAADVLLRAAAELLSAGGEFFTYSGGSSDGGRP